MSETAKNIDFNTINWDFSNSDKSHNIHSIHPYPAKFIPEIPREIINSVQIPEDTAILDPFCGSGVSLVEAQNAGYESFGVDLNPIACLISRVKTSKETPDKFLDKCELLVRKAKTNRIALIPELPNIDHWFQHDVQRALASIAAELEKETDDLTKEFFQLALSSIIVKVSNQESDTRYAAIGKDINYDKVFKYFIESSSRIYKFVSTRNPKVKSTIINRNILALSNQDIDKPIGLVVTSPPYPNAYEYWLYHKYRMWWLGFDPLHVKENEIGARAHYFKKNRQTADDFVGQMEIIFQKLNSLLVKGGKVIMVTGNSKIHGEIIDNEFIIANAGKAAGLKLIDIVSRNMDVNRKAFNQKHARIKKEHLVILEK